MEQTSLDFHVLLRCGSLPITTPVSSLANEFLMFEADCMDN